jgi:hypothetical protein
VTPFSVFPFLLLNINHGDSQPGEIVGQTGSERERPVNIFELT